ncbi:non-ribosomal peptide synthetase [Halioxenophilus sp. WMMB6]|uniref:non-ribosomal peptide synthetase n=1 Tax=Halioxenophilus sp. WMMB6 TaxID=3073815 RepID=UPI00295F0FA8|nr:non-ribosomal peptide synthetase [Halioxenophilus sp. WMMB6]
MDDNTFLDDLILAHASTTPDKIAIRFNQQAISYRQLAEWVDYLAVQLAEAGVKPGDFVATVVPACAEIIPALLASIRVGAVYMPLDPQHPDQQLAEKFDDTQCRVALTTRELQVRVSNWCTTPLVIQPPSQAVQFQPPQRRLEAPACIFFTSGTTGVPKGVLGSAQALRDSIVYPSQDLGFSADDTLNSIARYAWSISMLEMMAALVQGGTTLILDAREALDLRWLTNQARQCTAFHCPPALLRSLANTLVHTPSADGPVNNLRLVWYGGDTFRPSDIETLRSAFPDATLGTAYGTTEIFGLSHIYFYPATGEPKVLIGKPVSHMGQLLLDTEGKPVGPGEEGEIYMSGPRIAMEYRHNPEATRERFVTINGTRYFKTGDFVAITESGDLEFLQRQDTQVKIRGIRIELGEIEQALLSHEKVREACLLAIETAGGERELRAYVATWQPITAGELQTHLQSRLPDYMQPAKWFFLERLPVTENFKIDRKQLTAMEPAPTSQSQPTDSHALAEIWASLLEVPPGDASDNFFQVGGNSVLVIQLVMKINKELKAQVEVADIYRNATYGQLTKFIDAKLAPATTPANESVEVYATQGQVGLFFRELLTTKDSSITCTRYLQSANGFEDHQVRAAIAQLVEHYPTLRTNIKMKKPHLELLENQYQTDQIPIIRLQELWTFQPGQSNTLHKQAIKFNLQKGPLLGAIIFPLDDGSEVLQLTAHHIAADDNSMGRLAVEFAQIYANNEQGQSTSLPSNILDYNEFARDQYRKISSGYFKEPAKLLAEKLLQLLPQLQSQPLFEFDHTTDTHPLLGKHTLPQTVSHLPITRFMAALTYALYQQSGRTEFVYCVHVATRRDSEEMPAVGMFVNLVPIITGIDPKATHTEHLARSIRDFDEAMARSDLIYEEVIACEPALKALRMYPFDALLNEIFYNDKLVSRFNNVIVDTLFGTDRSNLNVTVFQANEDKILQLESPNGKSVTEIHANLNREIVAFLEQIVSLT